jgi:hypothetical protein
MKLYMLIFLAMLSIGCSSTKDPKTRFVFPTHLKERAHGQMNAAKACIESKGSPLSTEKLKHVEVYLQKGEKKFTHGWGWRSPEWNGMWVLGLCTKGANGIYIIKIGYNPDNPYDTSDIALHHEFGHMWLMHNYNDWSHNNKYSTCFHNWREPSGIRSFATKIGSHDAVIDYILDSEAHLYEIK